MQAYVGAEIAPERVFLQSFHFEDLEHWLEHWPDYAEQAVWLDGGGWYYQSIADITNDASMVLTLLDVLKHQIGVQAVFSDWPATSTFFAHCTAEHDE